MFNWPEKDGHVECFQCHFGLIHLTWADLYIMGVPALLDDDDDNDDDDDDDEF